jgi:hypothetical protein
MGAAAPVADLGTLMKNQGPVTLNSFFTIAGKK